MTASKNAPKKRGRPFEPGWSGGPGRAAGSRNKATLALDAIGDEAAKEILEKLAESAKGGDTRAAEIILSRVWPARKSRTVRCNSTIKTATDVAAAKALAVRWPMRNHPGRVRRWRRPRRSGGD